MGTQGERVRTVRGECFAEQNVSNHERKVQAVKAFSP